MRPGRFHRLCGLWLCLPAFAAFAQPSPDCSGARAAADPRCQAQPYDSTTGAMDGIPSTRMPVIRDPGALPAELDRAPQTRDQEPRPGLTARRAPEPPAEFQKYVEQFTGRMLPVFGQALFEGVPSTFAPAGAIAVTPDYTPGPGDQLVIRAWGSIDISVSPLVDAAGAIYIPRVGDINVTGIRFAQLQDYLKTAIGRVFRNFDLSVGMGRLRSIQVLVTGHARRPGAYTVSSLSTLVNAIFASGGPDTHGSMRSIHLMRGGREAAEFDLYDLLLHGSTSKDEPLLAGDVIYIPPVGPQVALTGSVNTPAIYELKPASTLRDALDLAGGLTPVAATRQATIERIEDSAWRVLDAPLDQAGSAKVTLRNGDIVSVLAVVPRFEETVTLRGNVADAVRLPWVPGMKIRDLIPDREALLSREYWRARNRLEPPDYQELATNRIDGRAQFNSAAQAGQTGQIGQAGPDGLPPGAFPISDSAAIGTTNASYRIPSNSPAGAPSSIGAGQTARKQAPKSPIERNALEINWSYAVIERRDPKDLRTSLIPFHLGKAIIDRSESENLPLQPGDVVTVFSLGDLKAPQAQQTRYVRLEGEFGSAGVYSARPGETLRDLVRRAGGLTPQAYLYGSEFLRESSRVEQQQRLDDLVDSLERQTASAAANIRGSVISPEEAASASSQIEAQRELVQKMRQVRAQGRIVLDLDPRGSGVDALPELPLEDGDVFTVPSRPSFVNVVGSVRNSTSFLYQDGKTLGDYLRAAGGPSSTGDFRHAFLIRADGSVIGKSWSVGVIPNKFEGLRLNPGDSVVVPEQINRTTFLKGLKDWSQVFAQFALGAAAINILR